MVWVCACKRAVHSSFMCTVQLTEWHWWLPMLQETHRRWLIVGAYSTTCTSTSRTLHSGMNAWSEGTSPCFWGIWLHQFKRTLLCSLVELHQGFGECPHQLGSAGDGAGSGWLEQPHCWRHLTSAEGLLVCCFNAHAAGCPASHWLTQQVFSGGKHQPVHHQTQSSSCTWQTDWTAEWAWRQRTGIQWPTKQLQWPQLSSSWRSQCQSLHHHEGFLSGDLDWQPGQPFSTGWHDHPQRAWRHFWHENISIPKPSTTCHCYTGNHRWTVFSWWHGQSADWTKQNTTSFFRV